jgi:PIN domain nuclease of toxin-antitoxin system
MPEVVVLDTHLWFWFINEEFDRFPSSWRGRIEAAEHVGVSPVSCYEIALAHQRGRLALPCSVARWLEDALSPAGIELLPLTPAIAAVAVKLSPVHRDPFDRLIIATTLESGAKLASVDGVFRHYPELADSLLIDR